MKNLFKISGGIAALLLIQACSPANFTSWQQEHFNKTPITEKETKTISLKNENNQEVQKLLGVGFDGSSNGKENFSIDKIMVGDRVVGAKNIIVPPGSSLNIQISYEPRNMETSKIDYGGWVTGEETPFRTHKPGEEPKPPDRSKAIQRAVVLAVYESPRQGIAQVELVGTAVPGPNGELSLPEGGVSECQPGGGVACFTGNFSIDIPKIFTSGPQETPLLGAIRFSVDGEASLKMSDLPPIVFVLKGNGPGEPLEGQPISAVSIVIRGVAGEEATGTFDGSQMELQNLSFRIQVVAGEIQPEDALGITPLVDFALNKLTMITEEPLTDGKITFKMDTTLSENPSGNPIFDQFFGNAQIIVRFRGNLAL
ncbi:MAG: hypothetical protein Q8P84_04310 [Deltaproteobacteria bacterium]|nr:hypothetical protein [Deltaproteobacteria bacterium]